MSERNTDRPAPPRRVLLAVADMPVGGKERVICALAEQLIAGGLVVDVVCVQAGGAFADALRAAGAGVHVIGLGRGLDVRGLWRIVRLLRRLRPDVIHVHDRVSLPPIALANRLTGRRPIVFTGHGLLVCARPHLQQRLAGREIDILSAVSEPAAAEYKRILHHTGPTEVIPNGVAVELAEHLRAGAREAVGLDDQVFAILAVGNIKPEKGYDDLLAAAEALSEAPQPVSILIAGAGQDRPEWPGLKSRAERIGPHVTVHFLGPRSNMAALYAAADGYVLSSRKEGLPMALLEAMAAGLPAAVTDVGSAGEVVCRAGAGWVTQPGDPQALSKSLAAMIHAGRIERQRLGQAGRTYVASRHSIGAVAEQYRQVYEQALADRGRGPSRPMRPSVVMLGPVEPRTGGMAVVMANLGESPLARSSNLRLINSGKTTGENRSLFEALCAQARLMWRACTAPAEVVHLHTCSNFSFWRDGLCALLARAAGRRAVLHIHGARFERFLAGLGPIRRRAARGILESASRVLVLGDLWVQALRPYAPRARWQVVHNGVAVPDSASRGHGQPMRVLFLGNLGGRKRACDLVDAVARVAMAGVRVEAVVAGGETAPGERDALLARINERALADRICLPGPILGADKAEQICRADCLVLPSEHEGLPMAVLEAMAAGLPVVATRVGALAEAITDGVEGYLIDVGDVDALADRLVRLASDPDLRERMGASARRKASAEFSLDVMAERLADLYGELTRRKAPA